MSGKQRVAVLVAGSANLDFVVRASHVPAPGETVLGRDVATFAGGKGANQAVACARAGGAPTRMLLALGDDAYAAPIEASLRDAGVALQIVRCADRPTGTAFVCVSDAADNAITVAPGANEALAPEHLPPLDDVSHLLLQLESPIESVTAWARVARDAGVVTVLNAAPARPLPEQLLWWIDVLIVNEGELAHLTGIEGDVLFAMSMLKVPCVVVTLGASGCYVRSGFDTWRQPAFPVGVVDTTAAGDTFCGTLVAALAADVTMTDAVRRASAASALACTRPGAQASVPSSAEVDALLRTSGMDAVHPNRPE